VDTDGNSCGHGRHSVPALLDDLAPLFDSDRGERIIVAGDFNMWPSDTTSIAAAHGLVDCIAVTADNRPALAGCSGCGEGDRCGHLWTHRNGNGPNAAVQQIDFILASPTLARDLTAVYGGPETYPGIWDLSDHAPVVAEFS
jgi:endonuclease/exonuclease/phosphatase family metal-dependent hydrolase